MSPNNPIFLVHKYYFKKIVKSGVRCAVEIFDRNRNDRNTFLNKMSEEVQKSRPQPERPQNRTSGSGKKVQPAFEFSVCDNVTHRSFH